MMKLFAGRAQRADSSAADTDAIELTDVDLECGFGDSLVTDERSAGVIFGRPLAEERRRLERELILKYDTRELKRGDAWFLVETTWLDAWMAYILSEEDPDCPVTKPGPVTNYTLFDPKEYCLKKGLVATKDYRGVNPQVYALYAELYGTAGAKPIVRWTLDIYAVPVMVDDVHEMLRVPELKARVEVSELNDKFVSAENAFTTHRDRDDESYLYKCCCRCTYLVPCLGRLMGHGPTYKADKEKKTRHKRRRSRRRRRSYDYDEEERDDSDDSGSGDDIETRGLLG